MVCFSRVQVGKITKRVCGDLKQCALSSDGMAVFSLWVNVAAEFSFQCPAFPDVTSLYRKSSIQCSIQILNLHKKRPLVSAWYSLLTNSHQLSWGIRICRLDKEKLDRCLFISLPVSLTGLRALYNIMTKQGDSHPVHRVSRCQNTSWCNKGGLFSHVHLTFVFSSPSRLTGKTHTKKHRNWMKISAVGTCLSRVRTKSLFAVSTHLNVSPL